MGRQTAAKTDTKSSFIHDIPDSTPWSSSTCTVTSIDNTSAGLPWKLPVTGATCWIFRATATGMRLVDPTDLLVGYLLGAALLVLYLRLQPGAEAWLAARNMGMQLAAALALPSLILLLSPHIEAYQIKIAAAMMGMGVGFVLERRWVRFDSGGSGWKRVLRLLSGIGVMIVFREGLGLFEPGADHESAFRFVRYLSLGLGGALVAPWLFVSVGLAEKEEKRL